MKFTRQEEIITTVAQQEISDLEEIRSFLCDLKKEHLKFSLIIRKRFESENDYHIMNHKKVTVKNAENDEIEFLVSGQSAITKIRVPAEDIIEIKAITGKNEFLKYGNPITKFDVMDV